MLADLVISRVKSVNVGKLKFVELASLEEHSGGDYAALLQIEGKEKSGGIMQIRISKPMVKSLLSGKKNPNLDNLLRI